MMTQPLGADPRETVFVNPWFSVERVTRPNGKPYDVVATHGDVVAVIPVLVDVEHMILVNQYRVPVGGAIWEVPAGMIDPGEKPARAALRELREETGYTTTLEKIWPMGPPVYTSPGLTTEKMHLFVAVDCAPDDTRIYDQSDVDHEEINDIGLFKIGQPPSNIEDLKTVALLETLTSLLGV